MWQGSPVSSLQELVDLLRSENATLLEDLGNAGGDLADCYQEKEKLKTEISRPEVSLGDSNASIATLQKEAEKWRTLAEYYQNSLIQWSDGINQISQFLQSLKTEIPVVPLGYDWTQWR